MEFSLFVQDASQAFVPGKGGGGVQIVDNGSIMNIALPGCAVTFGWPLCPTVHRRFCWHRREASPVAEAIVTSRNTDK